MQKNMDIVAHPNRAMAQSSKKHVSLTRKRKIFIAIILIVLVIAGGVLTWYNSMQTSGYYIQSNKYQVVVLSNNQIYFGKLQRLSDQSYRLTSVYYLQEQSTAGASTDPAAKADQAASTATPQLVKLGNELHGPDDAMFFNDTQVLYWENLKSDGKVSKAIEDHLKQ
ncbi:hypothetical protein HY312_01650 [Candidatus Saccharibacteria bacterium]|nr:hypothetical protein [Candidatus Saccharibacteria bacterium]